MPAILIIRPENRFAADAAACRAAGWTPVPFAPFRIVPLPEALSHLPQAAAQADALFWSSPTAAETAAPHLSGSLKTTVPNIAVGAQTAAALQRTGFTNIHHSETGSDSEAAFSLPVWNTLPQHARVLIVRGTGGRAWLGGQLAARGFTVEYAEIYLREPQELDWARFQAAAPEAAWAASSEAVRAIFARCPPPLRQKLKSLLYFARHARIAETLSQSGAQRVRTADGIGSALNAFSPNGETQNV